MRLRLKALPRTVIVLGFVSLFNDLASEMVVPLLPILLSGMGIAAPVFLGMIEGIADAVAAYLKLWSGRRSDWLGGKRKGFAVAGYLLSNLARPLIGLAGGWLSLLALRSVDRVGKGLRSAPRDALVADATPPAIHGLAFGFHRALDNAGAVGGSLVAAAVLTWTLSSVREVILWSVVPGVLGVLLVMFGVKEPAKPDTAREPLPPLRWSVMPPRLRRYLLVLFLFTFARASETFIVLRGHELGMSVVSLLLLWAGLNFTKALTATRGGDLADRIPRTTLIAWGWLALSIGFALFAWAASPLYLWLAALAYGLVMGLAEGPERALISDFASAETRGTAFGWYHLLTGVAAIPAGLMFGGLWQIAGASWAFGYGALIALGSVWLLVRWVRAK
ncbi:MAG: MFS transporter [Burkholderiales bacterium]